MSPTRRAEERTLKSDDHVYDVVENEFTEAEQAAVAKNLKERLKDETDKLSCKNALPHGEQIETEEVENSEASKHLDDCKMTEVSGNRTIDNEVEDFKDPVAEEKEPID